MVHLRQRVGRGQTMEAFGNLNFISTINKQLKDFKQEKIFLSWDETGRLIWRLLKLVVDGGLN